MWRKGKLKDERIDAENPPAFVCVEEKPTCCSVTEKHFLSHLHKPTSKEKQRESTTEVNSIYKDD